ncbi:MAG TPA: ATPase, partial [Phycisphaerae bacterium]|nr:ATPase [Phycisphaerae bacterium]
TRRHDAIEVGVSPRGALSLLRAARASALLHSRDYAVPDDFKLLARPVFAHRIVTKSYLREGHSASADQILMEILESVPAPN